MIELPNDYTQKIQIIHGSFAGSWKLKRITADDAADDDDTECYYYIPSCLGLCRCVIFILSIKLFPKRKYLSMIQFSKFGSIKNLFLHFHTFVIWSEMKIHSHRNIQLLIWTHFKAFEAIFKKKW